MTSLSDICEKHGKGDDPCAYVDWAGCHCQKEEDEDERKGTERRERRR